MTGPDMHAQPERPGRLAGETAIVSGAAGGIGAAVCARFVAEGARVFGLDRLAPDLPGVTGIACDLSSDAQVAAAADAVAAGNVVAGGGPATILVHAAAVTEFATTLTSTPAGFARVFDVNVGGALRLVQAVAPGMCAGGRGSIVLVSSITALVGAPGLAAYAASKGALNTFARTLALELAPQGVRVNTVCPASVDTPMLRASFAQQPDPEEALARNIRRHPIGRLGTAADIADLILFLASAEAAWITGSTYTIDGGASIARRWQE